jgi:hypothetical protein
MQRHRLARRVAAQLPPIGVQPREARAIEKSQAGIRGRDQVSAPLRVVESPAVAWT